MSPAAATKGSRKRMDETSPRTGAEHQRLSEITDDVTGWRRWGPYVSDRSWATVR